MFKKISSLWLEYFYTKPYNLWGLRVSMSVLVGFILLLLLGNPLAGLTVSLGVVAAALSDDEAQLVSVFKSTAILCFTFFIVTALSTLLYSNKVLFGVFFILATFFITAFGAYKEAYAKLSFGTVLIIIYAIFVYHDNNDWYKVPALLVLGAFIYGLSTYVMLLLSPYRNIKSELANGYRLLAKYLEYKAKFFPSNSADQEGIRNELALINIELFTKTEAIKYHLQQFFKSSSKSKDTQLQNYTNEWNQLQQLHERAVSSHEPYDLISEECEHPLLVEGFGKMLRELALTIRLYADCFLHKKKYQSSISFTWTKEALQVLIHKMDKAYQKPYISFLYNNISTMGAMLDQPTNKIDVNLAYSDYKLFELKRIITSKNTSFRHAIRLSICFLAGYLLMNLFDIEQGAWIILTSFLVCQQTYGATRQKFLQRIVGTLLGVFLGLGLTYLVPTVIGQTLILLVSIYLFFKYLKSNYTVTTIFITTYVLEVYNLLNGSGLQVMLPRIIDTIIGAVLAYFSIRFIWPEWQYKNLKPLLLTAISKNQRYFESVMDKDILDEQYLHNQRSAHRADNQLTQVWKSMRIEPNSKRKLLTAARNFTYLNHSLLSYISAFGSHRKHLEFSDKDIDMRNEISSILKQIYNSIEGGQPINFSQEITDFRHKERFFLDNILTISLELKEASNEIKL